MRRDEETIDSTTEVRRATTEVRRAEGTIDGTTEMRRAEEMIDSENCDTKSAYDKDFPALASAATVRNKRTIRGSPVDKAIAASDTSTSPTSAYQHSYN